MAKEELIKLRNKKTGEVIEVPRSQYIIETPDEPSKGFKGVGEDIQKSLKNFFPAVGQMIPELAAGAKGAAKNVFTHPVRSGLNAAAGLGEGAIAMLNAPGNIAQYLADKDLISRDKADQVLNIPDLGVEKALGIGNPDKGDEFIKMLTSFLIPGKAAKATLPERAVVPAAMGTLAAGENQDPLQAAMLGYLGERGANLARRGVNRAAGASSEALPPDGGASEGGTSGGGSVPQWTARIGELPSNPEGYMTALTNVPQAAMNIAGSVPRAVKKIPELAAQTAASAFDSAATYGGKVPFAGGVLEPGFGILSSYLKHLAVPPEKAAQRKLYGEVTSGDLPGITERVEAARRIKLPFLTLSEAMLSPFQATKEANIGNTSAGRKLLYGQGKERNTAEATALDSLFESVYDEKELSPEKKANYESAMASTVPQEFIDKWSKDFVVEKATKQIESEAEYKRAARNMPKDSFKYWDLVKRVVADIEKEDPRGTKKTKSDQATQARNEMVDQMDRINPNYETARNIAEREFTRKSLEDVFDSKEMTINNFHSLLKSDKKYNKLLRKLAPFPEATQILKDIKMFSNELIPFDDSIRTAYKLEKTGMTKDRNKLDAMKRALDEKFGIQHDVAAVKEMTHPEMLERLTQYLKENRR